MSIFGKGICYLLMLVFLTASVFANGQDDATGEASAKYKVAMICSAGGLGDRSYNDSGFEGLKKIESDFGMEIKVVEPNDVSEGEKYLITLANAGFDLIATLEYGHADILDRVAPQFPDTQFAIFSIVVDQPNVTSVIYKEHEGSFLAGVLAALVTSDPSINQTNAEKIISAIGGVQSTGIDKFIVGYEEGAHFIDPEIKVLRGYTNSFGDPAKGKEMALVQIEQGSDVIFQIAGGTGEGVFLAAKEENIFAIGVDSDQDYIAPGNILTSMMKRIDMGMVILAEKLQQGSLDNVSVMELGLAEGTELSPMTYTRELLKEQYIDNVEELRNKILSGEISVTDITRK